MSKSPLFGINGRIAWRLYCWLVNIEAAWQDRQGYVHGQNDVDYTEDDGEGRWLVRRERVEPPSHWLYGRLIRFMYWLGFVPF